MKYLRVRNGILNFHHIFIYSSISKLPFFSFAFANYFLFPFLVCYDNRNVIAAAVSVNCVHDQNSRSNYLLIFMFFDIRPHSYPLINLSNKVFEISFRSTVIVLSFPSICVREKSYLKSKSCCPFLLLFL